MGSTVVIEPLPDPLLLDPHLVVDAIQEVLMQQNDHLVILEEDEAKAIAKEVTLDKGLGGTILSEPLLNPLLLNPPPVVKLDAIQEVLIEDSSSTHSTHPVMSWPASKQTNVHMGNI